MKLSTIGVVGKGFVGTAVFEGMKHAFKIIAYDKIKGWSSSDDKLDDNKINPYKYLLEQTDGPIFICVPSPMNIDGSCNTKIVEDTVAGFSATTNGKRKPILVIKSTIVPGTTEALNKKYTNVSICFNPEFLTERNYIEDFKNQDRIIIGGPHRATTIVKTVYECAFTNIPITKTSSSIAEMIKYLTNSFLATKVSFANEIKQICYGLDIDYDKVVEYAIKDTRLGKSHWSVPGYDGKIAWGGKCFPKDLNALISKAHEVGVDPKVMQAVWNKNLELRPERDWETIPGAITW